MLKDKDFNKDFLINYIIYLDMENEARKGKLNTQGLLCVINLRQEFENITTKDVIEKISNHDKQGDKKKGI